MGVLVYGQVEMACMGVLMYGRVEVESGCARVQMGGDGVYGCACVWAGEGGVHECARDAHDVICARFACTRFHLHANRLHAISPVPIDLHAISLACDIACTRFRLHANSPACAGDATVRDFTCTRCHLHAIRLHAILCACAGREYRRAW